VTGFVIVRGGIELRCFRVAWRSMLIALSMVRDGGGVLPARPPVGIHGYLSGASGSL